MVSICFEEIFRLFFNREAHFKDNTIFLFHFKNMLWLQGFWFMCYLVEYQNDRSWRGFNNWKSVGARNQINVIALVYFLSLNVIRTYRVLRKLFREHINYSKRYVTAVSCRQVCHQYCMFFVLFKWITTTLARNASV